MATRPRNALHDLGYKIFLDRYAQKDMTRTTLAVGDTVIVVVNSATGQREVGRVTALNLPQVTIQLLDGETVTRDVEHVDKPIETDPGQMMDRVARGIAEVEATPQAQREWTERFRWLLDDWKFVPGGRILTAAGTDQNLTFYNCMPGEQQVLTAAGYRPIAEVRVGDLVVTHRNRLRHITHTFSRETHEDLYIIKPRKVGYDDLRLTGEHKVYAIRSKWVNKHKSRDGLRLAQQPDWIPARELQVGDFVALAHNSEVCPPNIIYLQDYLADYQEVDGRLSRPILQGEGGRLIAGGTQRSPLAQIALTAEACEFFGRWLGDGCVTHRTGTHTPSGIKIVFGLDEEEEARRLAEVAERLFGMPTALKLSSTKRWYDLWVNSLPIGEFFKAFVEAYSHGKRIPHDLMQLPDDLTVALLRGLFQADGYVSKNTIGMLLANRILIQQVHQLLLRLGFLFSVKENTHRLARHKSYRLTAAVNDCAPLFEALFGREAPQTRKKTIYSLKVDDLHWVRIDAIEVRPYSGRVHDLEVAEDHSFVSAGVVVSNCYVVASPQDSREGIIHTLREMTEIMSRGGGVGINLSSLRPRHAYVKGVNGRSSGSVSWGALYSFVTGLIEQGGSRRGALMLILNDWHPDVFDFINSKRKAGNITNANISVGISDPFMDAVKADADWDLVFPDTSDPAYNTAWKGDIDAWRAAGGKVIHHRTVKARELWNALIESAWASAEPGLWFRDRANKLGNSTYFNPMIATNPCLTGDMRLHTDKGLVRLDELFRTQVDFEVTIDGRFGDPRVTRPSTRVFATGIKPVLRLETAEGYTLRATADHRVMTKRGWVEMGNLRPGDEVHILNRKGAFGTQGSEALGRVLGWVVGDGTIKPDRVVLSFFGDEKRELAPLFADIIDALVAPLTDTSRGVRTYPVGIVNVKGRDEARVGSARLHKLVAEYGMVGNKHQVPEVVFRGSEAMQRGFLQALFTADGSVQGSASKALSIRLASSHLPLLEQVQVLLANFGIVSRIYRNRRPEMQRLLPDGKGGRKLYTTKAQHELVVSRTNLMRFAEEIGFLGARKNDKLSQGLAGYKHTPSAERFVAAVRDVSPDGVETVYDVTTVPHHTIAASSIVVSNCGEQPLGAYSVCNLGALHMGRFYDAQAHDVAWDDLGQAVRYGVRFLDNVIDSTPYFFPENERVQLGERRVGLGTMGIAELLIHLGIRYGSPESVAFIDKLYHFIAREAYLASSDIAAEKGAFPMFEAEPFLQSGYMQAMDDDVRDAVARQGIRNVTLLTQAPTGTTGTMVNTSTGIEPFFSWVYYRKSRLGLHEEQVPLVAEYFAANPGAEALPDYFVTAMDLAPEEHVRAQAAFQRWVDSAISKTANLPNNYTVAQVSDLYMLMYDLGCKGGTVYRDGSRDEQVLMLKPEATPAPAEEAAVAHAVTSVTKNITVEAQATPHRVYPRPDKLTGVTVRCDTPFGTAYITMNSDHHGQPFEVFITAPGKGGSDLQADAEGLGRLISLALRTTDAHNRLSMLRLVIDQLRDIGGSRSSGFGVNRVTSLPDAVARALEEQYFPQDRHDQLGLPMLPEAPPTPPAQLSASTSQSDTSHINGNGHAKLPHADMCPQCNNVTLVRAEGCRKCLSCGYSEC